MTHIAMIGGTGAVGREALRYFLQEYASRIPDGHDPIQITLVSPHPNRGNAYLNELKESLNVEIQHAFNAVKVTATDQYDSLRSADHVVLMASQNPSPELRQRLQSENVDPRTILAFGNRDLIHGICERLSLEVPADARLIVITNQSDMMSRIAREYFPEKNVLGFGGMTDTHRFRRILQNHVSGRAPSTETEPALQAIQKCHMIGFHNDFMICSPSNPEIPGIPPIVLKAALQQTRRRGHDIALMRRDLDNPEGTAPSILAGQGTAMTMAALTGIIKYADPAKHGQPVEHLDAAFNVCLDERAAQIYGATEGSDLSVPVRLGPNGFEFIYSNDEQNPIPDVDKETLRQASRSMDLIYEKLKSPLPPRRPRKPATGRRSQKEQAATLTPGNTVAA